MAALFAPGKWNLHSSDNFDEFLKARGVSIATRLIVTKLKPSQHISVDDDVWILKTQSTFKNTESCFRMNEPFKETTPDGRHVEVLCIVDGNKLIRTEKGDLEIKTTREFSQDEFKMKKSNFAKSLTGAKMVLIVNQLQAGSDHWDLDAQELNDTIFTPSTFCPWLRHFTLITSLDLSVNEYLAKCSGQSVII